MSLSLRDDVPCFRCCSSNISSVVFVAVSHLNTFS
nr:MAG TPA: hypothetical protein [Caudoviricetes sp.]